MKKSSNPMIVAVIFAVVGFAVVIPLAYFLPRVAPTTPIVLIPTAVPVPTATPYPVVTPRVVEMNAAACMNNDPGARYNAECGDESSANGYKDNVCDGHGGVTIWYICPKLPVPTATKPTTFPSLPGAAAAPIHIRVGGSAKNTVESITVISVNKVRETGPYSKAPDGKIFIVMDVEIQSVGKEAASYNPLSFSLKDSKGYEYDVSFMGAPDPELKSGDLYNGDKVRGNVAFLVPDTAVGLVASYSPNMFAGVAVYIDLGM